LHKKQSTLHLERRQHSDKDGILMRDVFIILKGNIVLPV